MNRKMYRFFGVFIVLSLILAACGGGAAPATPRRSATSGAERSPHSGATSSRTPDRRSAAQSTTATKPAADASTPTPAASDAPGVVADLGFRPEVNGFQFENYGKSDAKNLTPA